MADRKRISIGIERYKEMIEKEYYYIDKTLFIIKILSFFVGRNPLPLGGGRSLVNCSCYPWFSMYFCIVADDTSPILQAKYPSDQKIFFFQYCLYRKSGYFCHR